MASLADLLPLVYPHVPGAPEPLVLQQLRLSAIDWCERTRCWRFVTSAVLANANSGITLPFYAALHEIEHAEFNGRQLEPVIYTDITPEALDTGTAPWALTQKEPGMISLLTFTAGTLNLSVWLKPKLGNLYSVAGGKVTDAYNEIPQHIIDDYAERLVDGALARLLTMNEPWANPAMAAVRMGFVEDKAPAAKAKSLRGQQRARVRSKTLWM